ncbi:MAG TPA: recombinase family protein [Sphingobium sp.]|uniref:recombinase family protein n=1 Tax=unclassified Sphingobium TaxID=2611147 RepID=UPI0020A0C0AF|nr:recombinase family protein [Sphingobium sp. OAS761]MCP1472213.1 DNA invertase Pin-like site-specific DNA recombinase [Sphingobium sp. OAS761]
MFVRAYLRASTSQQDASRARGALDAFAAERGLRIAARYMENESGAKLDRPELFRLLADCEPGDVLLVEQVDRLSRLTAPDWMKLRSEIDAKQVRIVALDLPTSWSLAVPGDDFTARMFSAVNNMMLDVLAAVARKDYDDRRRRQSEGTARAKAAGLYKGRPENKARNVAIASMLGDGRTWREVMDATGCSRTLLAKIARDLRSRSCEQAEPPSPALQR